ncbi:MAG: MoxR family ATPase [Pseudomonadota bacterium]|nr:MoxR family ATPase [Pseudomonadota bacterium]
MMELNEIQKSVVEILYKTYKKDTVTRAQINALVKKKEIKNPSWLKDDKYKVGRGVYKLPMGDESEKPETTDSIENLKTDTKAAYIVSSLTDNVVPGKDKDFVNFGNFSDVKNIISSKKFYPVFITGLSGNGKTLAVTQACAVAKREMIRVNVTIETDEDDLLGGYRLRDGQTVWQNGPVIEAMERGAVLLLDEIDLASNKIMCLQPILEGSGIYVKKTNKWVRPKYGFNVIATANTKGQGSEDGKFIGTNVLNEAFLERFPVTFEQEYPTARVEEKIVSTKLKSSGKSDQKFAHNLVTWADVIRRTYFDGGVDEIISTRRLVHIAEAYSIFKNKMKAITVCTNRFDDDVKNSFVDLYTKVDSGASVEDILKQKKEDELKAQIQEEEKDSNDDEEDKDEDSDIQV